MNGGRSPRCRGGWLPEVADRARRLIVAPCRRCRSLGVSADRAQPHPDLGPVRPRLRPPVRLYRPAVLRPVGVLRHRRLRRGLSADQQPDANVLLALAIGTVGAALVGVAGRADRAAPHRHLFRDDHGRDRGDVLLPRELAALAPGPAARTACPACRRRSFNLGFIAHQDQPRLVDVWLPRGVLLHRPRDRAAHRALAGRRAS